MSYVHTTVPGTSLATPPAALGDVLPELPWWLWLAGGYLAWRALGPEKQAAAGEYAKKGVRHARLAHAKWKLGAVHRRQRKAYQASL